MAKLLVSARPREACIESRIGVLLKTGVVISGLVILLGGLLFLTLHGGSHPDYHLFRSEPESLRTMTGIAVGTLQGDSRSIIQFGILLLIATPIARVLYSVYAFLKMRDYQFVLISGIVLAVLIYSLIWH